MTSRLKSFRKFVTEQSDDNPNPKSGKSSVKSSSLEVDLPASIEADPKSSMVHPTHHAMILHMAQAVLRDRAEGTEKERPHYVKAVRRLAKAGVGVDKLMELGGEVTRITRRSPHMGPGVGGKDYSNISKAYQKTQPPGENLDTEA